MHFKKRYFISLLFITYFNMGCREVISNNMFKTFEYESINPDDSIQGFNFSSKREFINDSEFIDHSLLCQSDTISCGIKFLIKNQDWYIYNGRIWKMFYSKTKNSLLEQPIYYYDEVIESDSKPIDLKEFKSAFVFKWKEIGGRRAHPNRYFFHPDHGVIGIESNMVTLIRTDFIKR